MRMRRATSWLRRPAAVTLVEAVAGTAILATVLVAILIAAGRLRTQSARAERRVEACRIADGLLRAWWPERQKLPRDDSGQVPDHPGWTWKTQPVANEAAEEMGAAVVALEVYSPAAAGVAAAGAAARVEIVLPDRSNEKGIETDTD